MAVALPVPIFRSDTQADVLAALYLSPASLTIRDLSLRLSIPYPTVHREVLRLVEASIVTEDPRIGNYRYFKPNVESPFNIPLQQLIEISAGPVPTIKALFSGIEGIEWIAIFGSWAHRLLGKEGEIPNDLDLMVVGNPNTRDVNRACLEISKRFGWIVNPTILTSSEWRQDSPFLSQVRSDGLVPVIGQPE